MKFKLDYRRRLTGLIYTVLKKSLLHILSLTKYYIPNVCKFLETGFGYKEGKS